MKRSLAHFAGAMGGALVGADAGFSAVSTDSRTLAAGELFVALIGPNFDGHAFVAAAAERGAAGAVVARPVPVAVPQILVPDTLRALQRAAESWRAQFHIPVIAVAGSNGKTTSKELIATVLAGQGPCHSTRGTLNNHIGVPLTLLGLEPRHTAAVVEIGANHPGEVAALLPLVRPTVGVVTNAGAEHLEGFGDLDGVARAEGELFAGLEAGSTAVINADDAYATLWTQMSRAARRLSFGFSALADFRAVGAFRRSGPAEVLQEFELVTPVGRARVRLALAGRHNVVNALGAAAAAHAAGVPLADIAAGLERMRAVKGRLQPHPALNGAQLIDDSYNANPSSLSAGLEVLAGVAGERWLVLGDMGELGTHSRDAHVSAGREARARGVARLFAVGSCTPEAVGAFGTGGEWFADSAALAERVSTLLAPGVTVLIKGSRMNHLERVVEMLRAPQAASPSRAATGK
ncbi:MAG TPA: UDP-N-acetylmuramoyl-tripeptide--D-alanyl-D-alanine ligase [Steroidobacteraceae bacterium]|nr:UDP-N-acetylmuramoyl-tripeptide--D-alanyl-D-alanine ligase [Steroidobacteraceae bacterium]